jgi:hypothetical protein
VGEDAGGDESAGGDEPDADNHPADAARGDVDHHEEQAEEQDRGAQVPLEDQHADAHEPGGEHGAHVLEPRELDGADFASRQQDEIPVGGKIPGEEYGERDLGDLTGLERHGAELDPHPRPEDLTGRYAGNQRQDQKDGADRQGDVGEAAEDPVVLEEPDHGNRDRHCDQGPPQLVVARVFADAVQPVDHGQAESIEGHHQRKYYRIGIFRPEAQDEVEGEGRCGEQARLEPEISVERLLLVHAHEGIRADADREGQHQEDQFDVPARLGGCVDGCHWPASQTGAVGEGEGEPAAPGLAVLPGLAVALGLAVDLGLAVADGVAGDGDAVMHSSQGQSCRGSRFHDPLASYDPE